MPSFRAYERARSILRAMRLDSGASADPSRDPLTGLRTCAGLFAASAKGIVQPGAIVIFDLDHFRDINTALEFSGGDRVLIEVARRIEAMLPAGAIAARTGVDEFAILLPAASGIEADTFATRIAREIARPIESGAEQLAVTISIGIAKWLEDESLDGMLRRAGSAMRHHRDPEQSHGADSGSGASPDALLQRFTLEREIREAMAAGQLQLFYQPIVSLATHVADEFEALIRWNHDDRGTLLPAQFLFDIESDELLREIGRWVLREACVQGRLWQEQRPDRPLMMAVNLSSSQIRDPWLLEDVARILRETECDPGSIRLEISESITLDEIDSAVHLVRGLRQLGVGLALDDFGAGNSGWTLLRQSQVDVIKLDQSFISGTASDLRENIGMIEALAGFAARLGMIVSIEGVERADQAAAMREIGVQQAQGFYFARPQPACRVPPLLGDAPLQPFA